MKKELTPTTTKGELLQDEIFHHTGKLKMPEGTFQAENGNGYETGLIALQNTTHVTCCLGFIWGKTK